MLNSQVSGVAIQLRLSYYRSLKPCELQKPIPNHQSSFCWICLPLLTLSIIRSSCPPSHHWDSTSLVWILSHWSVFHGGLGRGGIQSTSIGHWGSPGIGSWTPPLLHIHYITGSHHTGTWLLLPFLCWWHTALSLISTRWSNGSCTDLRLPGGHLGMDEKHHLQLNLAKTELLVFPATPTLQHDFTIQLGSSTITPSASVRNLGVIFDDQLTFKEHIAKTAQSCRFALHNIRKIRPFLTEHAAQLLVQALVISRLDYCNALLAGLPSNTIKPLQMIQNAAARLVFNEPKRAHVTPLFVSLHWLPVAAHIQFKTLMLAYRTTTGSAPTYFHSLLRIYILYRSLRSASERRLVVPSQRGSKSLSRTFSFTVPGRWNDLPTPIRNAGSLSIFKQQLKTHLFQLYLTTWKKKKKSFTFSKSSSFSLSFSPSLASMYLFEQCLRLGVIGTCYWGGGGGDRSRPINVWIKNGFQFRDMKNEFSCTPEEVWGGLPLD